MTGDQGPVPIVGGPVSEPDGRQRPRVTHSKRRWHFKRRHTPHFYLVVTAITCAILVCPINAFAYSQQDVRLGVLACAAVGVTTLAVSLAFFWGFFLLLSGQVPLDRIKFVLPHACVGTLSPLLYMLNLSLALDTVGHAPVSLWILLLSIISVVLLGLQFSMGRLVVYRKRPHILRVVDNTHSADAGSWR